jgi:hypothetical protein
MNDFNAGFHGDGVLDFSFARYKIIPVQGWVAFTEISLRKSSARGNLSVNLMKKFYA